MRLFPVITLLLILGLCNISHISVVEGTQSWMEYSNLTMSYGYKNTMTIDAGNETSNFFLDAMFCDDQYDTGDEICCIVNNALRV